NRLVEVVPGGKTDESATRAAWTLQELIGKTPIASADASGFVVNRFFVPWLNEAVRLLEEGVADIPTIEW
ncbi:MAG: 3-hydroxybutyryl-CoA dehydrogenase, partial [Acidobacteria bacterium]|nr:3-hydroxybutyryl-CoA dehydrogenase [Acidobacteriota bacterium]NIM64360.1 3-hydroxybutyryl-CoA dehydrogenase [Acidobacteriota bacterium]NIO60238.1 3-hydroxybutyryl-CoA dehydrogenase [Acidobacteriota bacterium]NIQ31294.1 3-hydroxybutyryl-CoA dehydrogenase [Acidobacteriota bacterium]NIQ86517.1 3-hydroxybutyryl-CoA dehydrogenase [Acidobacteriota bacterium]